jgi:hypothetical protein
LQHPLPVLLLLLLPPPSLRLNPFAEAEGKKKCFIRTWSLATHGNLLSGTKI